MSWTNAFTHAAKRWFNSQGLCTGSTSYINTVAATTNAFMSISYHMFWKETLDKNQDRLSKSHTLTGIQTDFTSIIFFWQRKNKFCTWNPWAYFCSSTATSRALLQNLSEMHDTKEKYLILGIPVTVVLLSQTEELFKQSINCTITERKSCIFSKSYLSPQLEVSPYFSASVVNTELPHCQTQPSSCSHCNLFTEPSKVT